MSKEKLSAEALYPVWFEQHGRESIVDCLYPFAEWYAKQVTEQLQREREWISVEERLPDAYNPVAVRIEAINEKGWRRAWVNSIGNWESHDFEGNERQFITHWKSINP